MLHNCSDMTGEEGREESTREGRRGVVAHTLNRKDHCEFMCAANMTRSDYPSFGKKSEANFISKFQMELSLKIISDLIFR